MSYYNVRYIMYETPKFSDNARFVRTTNRRSSSIVLKKKNPSSFFRFARPVMPVHSEEEVFSRRLSGIAICSFILSRVRARVHGRTHSRAMALVLRGARAAGVLKQVATAPLAQVRPLGRAVPGPVANVVFVEKPRPACLLIRPRFRSMSARATHPSTHSPDERRPTPRAASASPRRDARAWARPSPRTSPPPVRYVQHRLELSDARIIATPPRTEKKKPNPTRNSKSKSKANARRVSRDGTDSR